MVAGYDPLVKEKEIGARAHFFKKNRHTSQTFVDQMTSAFRKFSEMLTLDGWVCFVVGRSIIHGETIDNAAIIRKVGEDSGFGNCCLRGNSKRVEHPEVLQFGARQYQARKYCSYAKVIPMKLNELL